MEFINPEIGRAYEKLAAAIVMQAVKDYKQAYAILKGARRRSSVKFQYEQVLSDCKRFFRSEWFCQLCEYDGERLMQRCEENYLKRNGNTYTKKL